MDAAKLDAACTLMDGIGKRFDSLCDRRDAMRKDGRADAVDRRAAIKREHDMLTEHLTGMDEAHERERVEQKIAALEDEMEGMDADTKKEDKAKK